MGRTIDFSYGGTVEELYREFSDKLHVEDVDFQLDTGFFDIFTVICEKPTSLGVGWIA